jgi:hypothetical protein
MPLMSVAIYAPAVYLGDGTVSNTYQLPDIHPLVRLFDRLSPPHDKLLASYSQYWIFFRELQYP